MGCCGQEKKKSKVEKKKNLRNNKEIKENHHIPEKIINQNQLLKTENIVQDDIIKTPTEVSSHLEHQPSSDYDISPIETFNDFQTLVQQNKKPLSIVLFYGRYCPYSKRIIPGLRQWAQTNRDRIFLYEADVEQASKLAEYYHVRTIPTIMAFEENNLLAPIWQRTANNVYESEPMKDNQIEEIFREELDNSNKIFLILDSSVNGSNRLLNRIETPKENQQEQYLILLDNKQTMPNKSELILSITNEKDPNEFLKTIDRSKSDNDWNSKSITSSQQSPYIWNQSIPSQQSQLSTEYNGRMISKSISSTISNADQLTKKRTWSEHLDDNILTNEYQQHIHLPNSNEIYYEKQYNHTNSSFDRFSTLTYDHVKNTNNLPGNQQEEICILYLGPNRCRGFEENLPIENNSSKLSLVTLKSHTLLE